MTDSKETIRALALELGFDAVGFAPAKADPEDKANLAAFLDQGRHGTMDWMARNEDRRADPQVLWPEARSVIALGMNYGPKGNPRALLERPERGAISVYAQGRDYHDVMKKRLKRLARAVVERFGGAVKVFVDTAPVMEKPLARRAGLGWIGKHANLVSRQFGSWLFLGEVFTTLDIPPDAPSPDHCGSCVRCLEACPTGALDAPYRMDAKRCVSYLTIERRDPIRPDLAAAMGNRIYGCDDCLAACPWNKFARPSGEEAFRPRAELSAPRLDDLAELGEEGFRRVFAGSPIKRSGWERMLRNILIARENAKNYSERGENPVGGGE